MWMYSNQQVFENKLVINKGEFLFSGSAHKLTDIFTHITPAMPYAILIAALFSQFLFKMAVKLVQRCTGCEIFSKERNMKVVQSLEPFFKALSAKQVESFLKEETICRDKLGFSRLTDDSYQ